jgi:hypothetical protein
LVLRVHSNSLFLAVGEVPFFRLLNVPARQAAQQQDRQVTQVLLAPNNALGINVRGFGWSTSSINAPRKHPAALHCPLEVWWASLREMQEVLARIQQRCHLTHNYPQSEVLQCNSKALGCKAACRRVTNKYQI